MKRVRYWLLGIALGIGLLLVVAGGLLVLYRRQAQASSQQTTTSATTLPTGTSLHSIVVDEATRAFRVYRPASVSDPAPLVVMLHGGFGSAENAESSYGWDQEADAGHFVVAYPDGENHAWNAGGGCCGMSARNNVNDVLFITDMVQQIEHALPIDTTRIYATGISNGGMMSYRLACSTTLFAAIGPDSATQLGACDNPQPISIIHIHGVADQTILYNGGTGSGRKQITDIPVPTLNAQWRQIDQCQPPQVTTQGVVTTSLAECPDGRAVELISIADAGHQWPGSAPKPLIEKALGTDPPSTALNATATIWRFFAAHHK